jgi:hypothetical protein
VNDNNRMTIRSLRRLRERRVTDHTAVGSDSVAMRARKEDVDKLSVAPRASSAG